MQNGAVTGASTKVHTNKVVCVRWVHPTPSTGSALISTGSDAKAVVWTVSKEKIEGLHILHPSIVLGMYLLFYYEKYKPLISLAKK